MRTLTLAASAGSKTMLSTRYTLIGLCVAVAAPCMAQSPDPFRSAPPPAPDSFRSVPATIPAKPVPRPPSPRPSREPDPTPDTTRATPAAVDPDLAAWHAVEASKNAADFQTYLGRFPQGRFVDLAQKQIAALRTLPIGPFDGTWTGMWGGEGGNRATLVIKQMGPSEANVTYTFLATAPGKFRAAITGNELLWNNQRGTIFFSFTLNSDGSLRGKRSSGGAFSTSLITMQRQQ